MASLIKFPLGKLVATPAAMQALEKNKTSGLEYLQRHHRGDWGDLDEEDKQENDYALDKALRLFSAYILPDGQKLWIITEADRSVTTFLLPSDY